MFIESIFIGLTFGLLIGCFSHSSTSQDVRYALLLLALLSAIAASGYFLVPALGLICLLASFLYGRFGDFLSEPHVDG